jgi:hypothetical protein
MMKPGTQATTVVAKPVEGQARQVPRNCSRGDRVGRRASRSFDGGRLAGVWEPIVRGELAARAWSAIDAIADALAEHDEPAADLAVFWAYLATVRDDQLTHTRAARAMERFTASFAGGYASPALYDGLAGAGWAAAHIASESDELLAAIDAQLVGTLRAWRGPFDLVSGVAGLGVYFLERESEAARIGRGLVVDRLAAYAEQDEQGARWRTAPEWLPADVRTAWPSGRYDCGLAHGVPGVIAVLARIAARVDAPANAVELRDEALRWLSAQRIDDRLPAYVLGEQRTHARIAWCYGDAGIAAALLGVTAMTPTRWIDRPSKDALVRDDGLCHGAAGLAHLANRLFQHTHEDSYRVAALAWLAHFFEYQRVGEGVGGFGHEPDGVHKATILCGSTGVGLVLLALVSELEPSWDRALLCEPFVTTKP